MERNKALMDWDLSSYFPEFNGSEMNEFKKQLQTDVEKLYSRSKSIEEININSIGEWEEILLKMEDISKRFSHLRSYVGCLSSADSNNEGYLTEEALISSFASEIEKLQIEFLRALKDSDIETIDRFKALESLQSASYYIEKLYKKSEQRMSSEKEILASELNIDGISSWGRLYNTVSGKLMFNMKFENGEKKRLPISHRRSLMEDPDREIRKAAFYGGNEAWESIEHVASASLNAISGTRLTLNKHRGIDHFLDVALFQSSISNKTLSALFEAIYQEIAVPKDILRLKAETIGENGIAWYDLGAPLETQNRQKIDWEMAKTMVYDSFYSSYPKIGDFFQGICAKNWIDYTPRVGKRPGGFCTSSLLTNESRIFMTFNNSLGDVLTLAHEAGHAFHSYIMKDLRPYQHYYPMTLAESASTFGEMILSNGILNDPSINEEEKLIILDTELNHAAIYLMDIPVRFEFEKSFYEERSAGEVSVSRIKELMLDAQTKIFGDLLVEKDPYFWASKLHFYITGVTFYNFPYTFGFLLSRTLYDRFKNEGESFLEYYEELLKLSGSRSCEDVLRDSIGEDIESTDFWVNAIKTLEKPLVKLKGMLNKS